MTDPRATPRSGSPKPTKPPPPAGILVVDKPRGPTSHDVVARIRRVFATREVGHAGTLDPMATGVLVVAIGEATKLVPWLTAAGKMYEAHVTLGARTDTLDADGRVLEARAVPAALLDALGRIASATSEDEAAALAEANAEIRAALAIERSRTRQVPPAFAAIRQDGERAYVRARRGEDVVLDAREVAVDRFVVTGAGLTPAPWLSIRIAAAKGYYVRSAARDLAESLGTFGHLSLLRRIRSGEFTLAEACAFPALDPANPPPFVPLAVAAARCLPSARLGEEGLRRASFGQKLHASDIDPPAPGDHAWFDADGALVAIGARIEPAAAAEANEEVETNTAAADDAPRFRVIRGFARAAAPASPASPSETTASRSTP